LREVLPLSLDVSTIHDQPLHLISTDCNHPSKRRPTTERWNINTLGSEGKEEEAMKYLAYEGTPYGRIVLDGE